MFSKVLSSSLSLLALSELTAGVALPLVPASSKQGQVVPGSVFPKNSLTPKPAPVTFFDDSLLSRRDPEGAFALRDSESFYYGDSAINPIANVTGVFKGKHEHVINMDRFAGMLQHVDCRDPDLMMDFRTKTDFENAKKSWNWVNNHKKNSFIMVANYPGCSPLNDRQPFKVTSLKYDEKKYKIMMKANQMTWEEALPEWHVHADTKGVVKERRNALQSRTDVNKTFSPSVAHSFSQSLISTSYAGLDFSIDCDPCGTEGNLDIEFIGSGSILGLDIDSAIINISPSGVAASLALALKASGTLTDGWEKNFDIFSAPLPGGFEVPFVKIGPNMNIQVGASIGEWGGEAKATYGAKVVVPDESSVHLDLVNGDESDFSGWVPTYEGIGPTLEAEVTASAEMHAGATIELSAEILGKGFSAGIGLNAPSLTADFTAAASTDEGFCDVDDANAGVEMVVALGMDLVATAGLADSDPLFSTDLYSTGTDLFSTCFPFGGSAPTPSPTNDTIVARTTPGPSNAELALRQRVAERRAQLEKYF